MMPENQAEQQSTNLRRQAEERAAMLARSVATTSVASTSGSDTHRLIQQLEIHQFELEHQNEELRQARAELEANYDELYDFAPLGYFTLGRYGEIENTNLTGAGMLGQPRARLLGRRFAAFITPESLPYFNAFLLRVMHGYDKENCMVTLLQGDNTPVAACIEATGVGPDSNFRAVLVDITSAERARRALRECEERLNLALAASGIGVWEWERDSGDSYWSPECLKIFGVNSICPTLDSLAQLLHPQDAERSIAALMRVLTDGKEQSEECRINGRNGQIVRITARGQAEYDEEGKPLRLIGIVQDITECRQAEQYASPLPVQ